MWNTWAILPAKVVYVNDIQSHIILLKLHLQLGEKRWYLLLGLLIFNQPRLVHHRSKANNQHPESQTSFLPRVSGILDLFWS